MSTQPTSSPSDLTVAVAQARAFHPLTLGFLVVLSLLGAIIGVQLITTLGVTPNTSIIGALVAMLLARVPLALFRHFRSVHVQNLAQSSISAATFGAANSILLPIAVPYVTGQPQLMVPMFIGASLAMLLDGYMLYRMFNTPLFPAAGAWPPGVAAAESIKAGDKGGQNAVILVCGIAVGAVGSFFKFPMAAMGTACIGNIWALSMFGIGLLLNQYSIPLFGFNIGAAAPHYIPHGIMIGAGVVALIQAVLLIRQREPQAQTEQVRTHTLEVQTAQARIKSTLAFGAIGYIVISALIALGGGLYGHLSVGMLVAFVIYAAFAAFMHELLVGLAAMHSGWFPAFAVALITLVIGILLGFPLPALVALCGFSAATGPAFADMGYDLKAGFVLRNNGTDPMAEMAGRRQQLYAAMVAFVVAIPTVWFAYSMFFAQGLIPPVAKVYAATIHAGVSADVTQNLLLWAIPGVVIQLIGGSKRQLGVLLATGLLISTPMAGWAVMIGIGLRAIVMRSKSDTARGKLEVFAAGLIAGDALFSFFSSVTRGIARLK